MAYADPLAYERQRCAEIETRARARDLVLRRELIRAEHRERHAREMAEYRAGPVARRVRFGKLRKCLRELGRSYRAGKAAGRERVLYGATPTTRASTGSAWQKVREKVRGLFRNRSGRGRTGNMQRERTQAQARVRERAREQVRQREQQRTRQQERVKVKEKVRARSRSRSRAQRVR